jgi:ACS family tartrate transporter-like MFS transporter
MLLNGAHSDRTDERALHCIVPCTVMAVGFVTASYAHALWIVVAALALSFICFQSMQGPALALPTQFLAGRAAAAGIAAMNTITMFSGFVGPYWMGLMKDATGSYQAGLRGLAIPALGAAAVMFALTQSLRKRANASLVKVSELAS